MDLTELYKQFQEDDRLFYSQAANIEYQITMEYILRYAPKTGRILEIGAGTGAYSISLAKQGFAVSALELVEHHVAIMKERKTKEMNLDIRQGNALDLSCYQDNTFDVVLCLGPLYHLAEETAKRQAIQEAIRICKPGGVLFFAYINHDMVIVTETMRDLQFIDDGRYDKETFQLTDEPFCFLKVREMEQLMLSYPLGFLHHVAVDGLSELLGNKINNMSKEQYEQWLRFHRYMCEKPEALAYSNHGLYVAKKL